MRFSFLAKNTIGLDISDRSIEVVEVSAGQIIHKARTVLPSGIVERGRIKNQEKLFEAVKAVFNDAAINPAPSYGVLRRCGIKNFGGKKLIFGLPESQTFIHIFDIDEKKEDIESLVKNELCCVVPLESDVMAHGFAVQKPRTILRNKIVRDEDHLRVAAMAAERVVITEWKNFLNGLGFSRVSIVAETFASYIGLGIKSESLPIGVIDIGANTTMVGIYDARGVCFASSLEYGGDLATKKVSEAAGLSQDIAEKEKCQGGIGSGNEKVKMALELVLNDIINGVKECLRHCHERYGVEITNLIIIGGMSQMPGLLEYFKTQTGLNISLGSSSHLPDSGDLLYVEAVGLALYDKNQGQFPILEHGLIEEKKSDSKKAKSESSGTREELTEEIFVEDNGAGAKIKKQKIVLLAIFLIGIIAMAGAFWYRSAQDKRHQAELASKTQQFSFAHILLVSIPVAVDPGEQTKDRVAGRIIENKIQMLGEKDEAVQTSRIAVVKQLLDGEKLWQDPLSASSTTSAASATGSKKAKDYAVRWLVYNEAGANSLFSAAAAMAMQKISVAYSISNIEKISIEQTENKNIYLLQGEVLVATDKQVDVSP